MKSSRTIITLGYNQRQEVSAGVWENQITELEVKAEEESIFQRRFDSAMADSLVLTKRFLIRSHLMLDNLDYIKHEGKKYKVRSATLNVHNHYATIETGELI